MKKGVWIAIALVAAIAALAKLSEVYNSQRAEVARQEILRRQEEKRLAFSALVSQAAFGHLWSSPKDSVDPIDFGEQKERLSRIYKAQTGPLHEAQLVAVWSDIQTYAKRGLLILYRIDALERSQPSGWEVLESLQKDSASDAWWRRAGIEFDKNGLQRQFRETEASLNQAIGNLLNAVPDLSLPENGQTLEPNYFPSWRGAFGSESLELRNRSEEDLRDVLLFVTVRGKSGAAITHLHYLDAWAHNSALTAYYLYGQRDYANSQALEDPASIDVVALTQAGIFRGSYSLNEKEFDNHVKEYLSRVKFAGIYLGPYVEEGSSQRVGPGFKFSFSGLQRLPLRAATIRFLVNGQYEDDPWDLSALRSGETYETRTVSAMQPDTAELTLWFQDTSIAVTVPSGAPVRISGP